MKNNRLKYGLIGCLFLPIACSAQHLYFHYTLFTQPQLIHSVLKSMIYVPGGTFRFGPKEGAHAQVTLSDFYMTKYAITWHQYKSFEALQGKKVNQTLGQTLPIYNGLFPADIGFSEAQSFCRWVGKQVGLPMTLPTEEQWEYAARSGGRDVKYSTDNGKVEPGKNFTTQSMLGMMVGPPYNSHFGISLRVNALPPNPFGFYLMNANDYEWTRSCYKDYPRHAVTDPASDDSDCKYLTYRGSGIYAILTYENVSLSNKPRKTLDKKALEVFNRDWVPRSEAETAGGHFRCVINSGKKLELAKVMSALNRKSADNPNEK